MDGHVAYPSTPDLRSTGEGAGRAFQRLIRQCHPTDLSIRGFKAIVELSKIGSEEIQRPTM